MNISKPNLLAREIQELINRLCLKANVTVPTQPLEGYQISTRQMGFRILSDDNNSITRKIGRTIADMMWKDTDGSHTFAMLSEDVNGNLFELDLWKTDFSKPTLTPLN